MKESVINLTRQEAHECEVLKNQTGKAPLQVLKLENGWYFVTFERDAYGIRNCPYCGKLLNKEEE